jgi:hypothetical protein
VRGATLTPCLRWSAPALANGFAHETERPANVALDRALADDPQYSMALLLRQVIDSGAPPSVARLPMTPEEVAASYDEMEDPDQDDLDDQDDLGVRSTTR